MYCKLFLDAEMSRDELGKLVTEFVEGEKDRCLIHSAVLEIFVNDNDFFDNAKIENSDDGFLYFPYFLDIEPQMDMEGVYIETIATLITRLWNHNIKAVAACDFEDLLPGKGGIAFFISRAK